MADDKLTFEQAEKIAKDVIYENRDELNTALISWTMKNIKKAIDIKKFNEVELMTLGQSCLSFTKYLAGRR